MAIEETDYECPRCLTRYVLTVSVEDENGNDATARDFMCPKCGRRASELHAHVPGILMAYRRGA